MKKTFSPARVFGRLSMRKKMQYSFLVPILCFVALALAGMGAVFEDMYRRQLFYGIEQSFAQADAFITNYLSGMLSTANQVAADETLREILTEEGFGKKLDGGEIYREYYRLNQAISFLESGNSSYRIGIYLPDAIPYSENRYHVFPLSDLEKSLEEREGREAMEGNRPFFLVLEEGGGMQSTPPAVYLSLLRLYDTKDEDSPILQVKLEVRRMQEVLKSARSIEGSRLYLYRDQELFLSSGTRDPAPEGDMDALENGSRLFLEGEPYYYMERDIGFAGWRLVNLIPVRGFRRESALVFWLAAVLIVISFAAIAGIAGLLSRYFVGRIHALNQKMKEIGEGHLIVPADAGMEEGDELDALDVRFDFMMKEVLRLMKEQYRLGKKISEAQLRALQAQINPHFLYNTLDLINWGALDYGAGPVAKIARDLGEFYRLSLNHGSSVISIGDELRHVESFVRIENVHYEGAISLEISVAEEIRTYACLNILLQPFVENSIVHGIARHADITRTRIRIDARKEGEDIRFVIEDDGPGIDPEEIHALLVDERLSASRGFGINNVNFRLKLCYGERYGIFYHRRLRGTRVEILIRALDEASLLALLE